MTFIRRVEDFMCEHCGAWVKGTGYTNHCPRCLWSKHVDVDPGDRRAPCNAMMEPIRIEGTTPHYVVVHHCVACGFERRNRIDTDDNPDAIISIINAHVRKNVI